jgi:serine/threonine-protein kinase
VEKSEGNFIYLYYILPEIRAGRFQKGTVEELPNGLLAYYRGHWQQMQIADHEAFTNLYEPMVCILAVVQEPVTIQQLHLWTGKDTSKIQLAINKWQEFLKEQKLDGEVSFRIYHVSFQEFLSTMIDLSKCDELISNYYLDKMGLL